MKYNPDSQKKKEIIINYNNNNTQIYFTTNIKHFLYKKL